MNDKKKLGKGLDALLSTGSTQTMASLLGKPAQLQPAADAPTTADKDGDLKNIPIDLIQRGKYQPRTDMHEEALEELAASIKNQGVMQPIVIRPISSEKYEIIAGERRWRASQIAGLDTIPAIIKPVGDEAAIAMALIENIQRENLNPIEEAMALKRLQDEFELTQQEVADAVGKSRATVTNLIRLIGLHIDVRRMLEQGDLEMGHARALLALPDVQQADAARTVVGRGLSVRQTESLVRRLVAGDGAKKNSQVIDPDIKNLEDNLADKIGAKVMIQHTAKGKGRLVVKYNSLDELDGILSHIN
ncbi:MAG: ParB/RepB/Spo0J family partition protein [Gammaproteobacteria bacterium]|nr:ParB/RepB/Spo0J family partition protein [Gammaproteobacteria bacterium]